MRSTVVVSLVLISLINASSASNPPCCGVDAIWDVDINECTACAACAIPDGCATGTIVYNDGLTLALNRLAVYTTQHNVSEVTLAYTENLHNNSCEITIDALPPSVRIRLVGAPTTIDCRDHWHFSVSGGRTVSLENVVLLHASSAPSFTVVDSHVVLNGVTVANAANGGVHAINSNIGFHGVNVFHSNTAESGGAMYLLDSTLQIDGVLTLTNNVATASGGAIHLTRSTMYNSAVMQLSENTAVYGAAIAIVDNSSLSVTSNANASFKLNHALVSGAGVWLDTQSQFTVSGIAIVAFVENTATENGGAVYATDKSTISISSSSNVSFLRNDANDGAGVFASYGVNVLVSDQAQVSFSEGRARHYAAGVYIQDGHILITNNATITFVDNLANSKGGCLYILDEAHFQLDGTARAEFNNNTAKNGGAIYATGTDTCGITFSEGSTATFTRNTATTGNGGAIRSSCPIRQLNESVVEYMYNTAADSGGGVYSRMLYSCVSHTSTHFWHNTANYGGAMYIDRNSNSYSTSVFWMEHAVMSFGMNTVYNTNSAAIHSRGTSIGVVGDCLLFVQNSAARDIYTQEGVLTLTDVVIPVTTASITPNGCATGTLRSYHSTICAYTSRIQHPPIDQCGWNAFMCGTEETTYVVHKHSCEHFLNSSLVSRSVCPA